MKKAKRLHTYKPACLKVPCPTCKARVNFPCAPVTISLKKAKLLEESSDLNFAYSGNYYQYGRYHAARHKALALHNKTIKRR